MFLETIIIFSLLFVLLFFIKCIWYYSIFIIITIYIIYLCFNKNTKRLRNKDKKFLQHYGHCKIQNIFVCKTNVNPYLEKALDILSFGKWSETKKKHNFKTMYHLFLILDIEDDENIKSVYFEKLNGIQCNEYKEFYFSEKIPIQKECNVTLKEFFENTQKEMLQSFWTYDPFKNNCQDFVIASLKANNVFSDPIYEYMKQDVKYAVKDLPPFTNSISTTLSFLTQIITNIF